MAWVVDGPELAPVRDWARECQVAVCLPFYERSGPGPHSSAVVIDARGETVLCYRRISLGWRDRASTSPVYVEGTEAVTFDLAGQRCAIALCGDLWDLPELWSCLEVDVVLWPMWRDVTVEEWASGEQDAYAEQSRQLPGTVLLVNGYGDGALGGATCFRDGQVTADLPMGREGVLLVDIPAAGASVPFP